MTSKEASQIILDGRNISPIEAGNFLYSTLNVKCTENNSLNFFMEVFNIVNDKLVSENRENELMSYFKEFFKCFNNQTFLNAMPPSSNVLGLWKDPLQTLFCPERKTFVNMMLILANIPVAAELVLDYSILNLNKGKDFEHCLLGRFLCSTHLPYGIMQKSDFFSKMPMSVQEKQIEEQNIWQMSKAIVGDACEIFMSIFRSSKHRPNIKQKLMEWFGKCLTLNMSRNKLVHSLNSLPNTQDTQLASDGFFMNLTMVIFHIASPLITSPFDKILTVQLEYVNDSAAHSTVLPKLNEETKLAQIIINEEQPVANNTSTTKYTVLTQLFFLLHKCFQLSFHVLQGKFIELNQQLHRIQEMFEDLFSQTNLSREMENVKQVMSGQMSLYMSLQASMRQPEFMQSAMGLIISTCQLLVQLERPSTPSSSQTSVIDTRKIACIPEFVMDNVVDFVTFLRHFDDGYFETCGYQLAPLLEMVVLYMGPNSKVKNPHLRSKIPSLLECIIPQRDESPSPGSIPPTFYLREHLFLDENNWTHQYIIEALFSAFTTMELSSSGESVRFEEKFEYRRPMYCCLKFFFGKPKFDAQIKKLEKEALDNINDAEAPLCLKFLNLLINDATFLLDEALNYLGQLKTKEIERQSQGGKYTNQTDESNFQHMSMMAKYHNTLASLTIEQLDRMATLCSGIMVHPILVDRIACTLNYFLDHLVGPKRQGLVVKDKDSYAFKPKQLVLTLVHTYISLSNHEEFCCGVVNDGRSYSDQLLRDTCALFGRLSFDSMLAQSFETLVNKLNKLSKEQNQEDENYEDAPDEFYDPIMGTLMKDPVTLPSSSVVVDRKTIFRHLLSDPTDPFNRQPLSMADVISNDQLKQDIQKWIDARKQELNK